MVDVDPLSFWSLSLSRLVGLIVRRPRTLLPTHRSRGSPSGLAPAATTSRVASESYVPWIRLALRGVDIFAPLTGEGRSRRPHRVLSNDAMAINESGQRPVSSLPAGHETPTCPECDGFLRESAGETFCVDCGLIVDEYRIDHGPDWSAYNEDEVRHTGGPRTVTRHDRGLSTVIGQRTDGYGNSLSRSARKRLRGIRREHKYARFDSKGARNLAQGFTEINRIVGALDLTKPIEEQACSIFRQASEEDLLLGYAIESMAAASVYAACRYQRLPRQLEEIAEYARVEQARITKAYRTLNLELALEIPPLTPRDYIPRIASEVGAPDEIRYRSLELAECAIDTGIANGRNPAGVAAACLYHAVVEFGSPLVRGKKLTQTVLAEAACVTPVTLRNCWTDIRDVCAAEYGGE